MASEERRHLFIADKLASISLLDTTPNGRTCLVVQGYRLVLFRGNIQQYLGRQILVGLGHFANLLNRLFQQLCHDAKYSIVVCHVTLSYSRLLSV